MSTARLLRSMSAPAAAAALALAAASAAEVPEPAADDAATWMRVTEERDAHIDLEIAIRSYRRGADGPTVRLVGVAHIADDDYYARLQDRLDAADVVLYEAVAPTGAVRPGGATPEARRASTRAALGFLADLAARAIDAGDVVLDDVDALVDWTGTLDPRLADFAARAAVDAWGGTVLVTSAVAEDGTPRTSLASLGADRARGGEGEGRDLEVTVPSLDRAGPAGTGSEDGLQAELASALGLAFQLEALDYGGDHFVPSDLSLDEVNDAIAARGGDFALFEETLAGSSLPARLVRFLLGALRVADRLLGGTVQLSVKVMLVEMLANEAAVEVGLEQMGEAFRGVIIEDRNARVIEDLERLLAERPGLDSVAIFYGAGHMPDLEERLARDLGYEPTGEAAWERAIRVDLAAAGVTTRELLPMRMTMRRSLRQMQMQAERQRARERRDRD